MGRGFYTKCGFEVGQYISLTIICLGKTTYTSCRFLLDWVFVVHKVVNSYYEGTH